MCDLSNMAVSNSSPVLFKKHQNMGENLKYYNQNNIKVINKYLKVRTNIILPKYVQVNQMNSLSSYIGLKYTKSSNRM